MRRGALSGLPQDDDEPQRRGRRDARRHAPRRGEAVYHGRRAAESVCAAPGAAAAAVGPDDVRIVHDQAADATRCAPQRHPATDAGDRCRPLGRCARRAAAVAAAAAGGGHRGVERARRAARRVPRPRAGGVALRSGATARTSGPRHSRACTHRAPPRRPARPLDVRAAAAARDRRQCGQSSSERRRRRHAAEGSRTKGRTRTTSSRQ